jgi:hypothetical protein
MLMARIDDHCKRHPFDNLYKASAALVDELRQIETTARPRDRID